MKRTVIACRLALSAVGVAAGCTSSPTGTPTLTPTAAPTPGHVTDHGARDHLDARREHGTDRHARHLTDGSAEQLVGRPGAAA
jgi:hypothetical protein